MAERNPRGAADGLLGNVCWNLVSTSVRLASSLAASVMVARSFDTASLGLFELTVGIRAVGSLLIDIGVSSAMSTFVSELRGAGQPRRAESVAAALFWCEAVIAAMCAAVLLALAGPFADMLRQPALQPIMPVVALAFGLGLLDTVLLARMAAMRRFAGRALLDVLGAVVLLIGVGLVVASGWGVAGMVSVAIVVPALRVAVMIASGPPGVVWPPRLAVDAELRPRIVRFCLGIVAVTGFDAVLFQRSEFVLVSRYSGPTEVALFGLAFGLSSVSIAVGPAVCWSVLAPYIAGCWGAGGREAVASAYREVARYAVMLALPACIGAAAVAGSLVQVLYGRQYQGVAPALQLLLVGAAVGALVTPQSAVYLAIGRPGVRSLWGYPTAALDFVLAAALAPGHGAAGAAIAKSTAQACMVAFDVSYLRQKRLASPHWGSTLRVLAACGPMGLAAYLVSELLPGPAGLLLAFIGGLACYLAGLLATHALRASDLAQLSSVFNGMSREAIRPSARPLPWAKARR